MAKRGQSKVAWLSEETSSLSELRRFWISSADNLLHVSHSASSMPSRDISAGNASYVTKNDGVRSDKKIWLERFVRFANHFV